MSLTMPLTGTINRAHAPTTSIVMADDDPNDHLLVTIAAQESGIAADFSFVTDGNKLLDFLHDAERRGTLPDLIILDLRMPGLDGLRTLDELKSHPVLWQIPVIVFTSSTRPVDELRSYEEGARWFETKPSRFAELVEFVRSLPDRAHHGPYETAMQTYDRFRSPLGDDIAMTEVDDLSRFLGPDQV